MARKSPARFNDEEVELGLRTLALFSGNTRRASAALHQHGLEVAHATLYLWKNESHAERYERIYKDELPAASERAAQRFEELAEDAADVAGEYVESSREVLAEVPARDRPGAARNLMVTAATAKDKALLIRGQPTQIVRQQHAEWPAPLPR